MVRRAALSRLSRMVLNGHCVRVLRSAANVPAGLTLQPEYLKGLIVVHDDLVVGGSSASPLPRFMGARASVLCFRFY